MHKYITVSLPPMWHGEPFSTFTMQRSVLVSDGELSNMAMH